MFYDEDDNTPTNFIRFEYSSHNDDNVCKEISIRLKDKEYYPDILQEFVYFLQAIGFNYIAGLTAFDSDGNDMKSTDL